MSGSGASYDDPAGGNAPPPAPFTALWPLEQRAPCVISSPHSGSYYPPDLMQETRLDLLTLRQSEDFRVDSLCAAAPQIGLPLIAATYARAYVDCNRDAWELDPEMFCDSLPAYVNTSSPGVLTGFGTIPRQVTPTDAIYSQRLAFEEARRRVETVHRPYHEALQHALERTKRLFGRAFLIDVHSMPSLPLQQRQPSPDFVLGDQHGQTAPPELVDEIEGFLIDLGFTVARNTPYAGGYITQHYSRKSEGLYSLQIEIDRALYMNQKKLREGPGFAATRQVVTSLLDHIAAWTASFARRKAAE